MQATFEAKITDRVLYSALDAIGELCGEVERHLFVDLYIHRRNLTELKKEYLVRFGITARQFNAVNFNLSGKVQAALESQKIQLISVRGQVAGLEKAVKELERKISKKDMKSRERFRFNLHQKKRRLRKVQEKLSRLEAEIKQGVPRICFGSRRLFEKQFELEANGYSSHEEWLKDWQAARSAQFYCLGSKDETAGNQTCTLGLDGKLRLRVPDSLAARFGEYLYFENVEFRYGHDMIKTALAAGQAVHYRFIRRIRKGVACWYIQATTEVSSSPIATSREIGATGVDLNPRLIAVAQIDRFGNVTEASHISVQLQGRRQEQVEATLSDAVGEIVLKGKEHGVPIVIEKLDFGKKKAALREESPRYARMLSAFAYKKFYALLHGRAAREGVEVIEVEPAFTSIIGSIKFGQGYGLSPHQAAAVAIARRGLKFGERLRSRSALPLPARNRGRHVWSDWRRVAQRLRNERIRGRRSSEDRRGRRGLPSAAAPTSQDARPATGSRAASSPGRDSPAQVRKAVRLATG